MPKFEASVLLKKCHSTFNQNNKCFVSFDVWILKHRHSMNSDLRNLCGSKERKDNQGFILLSMYFAIW